MDKLLGYVRYLRYVVAHKLLFAQTYWKYRRHLDHLNWWHVLLHDLSKFSSHEFKPYANYLYYHQSQHNEKVFKRGVRHHYNSNLHHWQYWINVEKKQVSSKVVSLSNPNRLNQPTGVGTAISVAAMEMPDRYIEEMVIDWLTTSRQTLRHYPTKSYWPWLVKNWDNIILEINTAHKVRNLICTILQCEWCAIAQETKRAMGENHVNFASGNG